MRVFFFNFVIFPNGIDLFIENFWSVNNKNCYYFHRARKSELTLKFELEWDLGDCIGFSKFSATFTWSRNLWSRVFLESWSRRWRHILHPESELSSKYGFKVAWRYPTLQPWLVQRSYGNCRFICKLQINQNNNFFCYGDIPVQ